MGPIFITLRLVEQVHARVNQHGYAFPALNNNPSHGRCSKLQNKWKDISNLHLLQTMASITPYILCPDMDWISYCYLCIMLNNAHHMEARYILSNCTVNESMRKQISVQQQWAAASAESECTNQQTLFQGGNIHCGFTLNLEARGPCLLSIFIVCNCPMCFCPIFQILKRSIISSSGILYYETHILWFLP